MNACVMPATRRRLASRSRGDCWTVTMGTVGLLFGGRARRLRSDLYRAGGSELQPGDRLAQHARDVHLRDAELRADLRLREVFLEAQPQDLAFARIELR